jgi:hypothetical protein
MLCASSELWPFHWVKTWIRAWISLTQAMVNPNVVIYLPCVGGFVCHQYWFLRPFCWPRGTNCSLQVASIPIFFIPSSEERQVLLKHYHPPPLSQTPSSWAKSRMRKLVITHCTTAGIDVDSSRSKIALLSVSLVILAACHRQHVARYHLKSYRTCRCR